MSKEKFAVCLKQLRKEKGLSQEKLGLKANVDRSYIGRIENLKVSPSIEIMDKLAQALDTKPNKMC